MNGVQGLVVSFACFVMYAADVCASINWKWAIIWNNE